MKAIVILASLCVTALPLTGCTPSAAQPVPSPTVSVTTEIVYVPQPPAAVQTPAPFVAPTIATLPPVQAGPVPPAQATPVPCTGPFDIHNRSCPPSPGYGYAWIWNVYYWCAVPAAGFTWNQVPVAYACPH